MKHHFADLLDRTGDYWTIIPNRNRFAFVGDTEIENKEEVKILTITQNQDDKHWKQVFECPYLEEITLHSPSKNQVLAISKLTKLKRLRLTFFRTKDIEFIGELINLEELVFEYVSGFSDLSPLKKLTKLKSLHLENLRRVSNFDALGEIKSLKYLMIDGTLDWNQPIENFNFFKGLTNLEVLSLGFVSVKADFPAFLPIIYLEKLKKINIGRATFNTQEYALLKVINPEIEGCNWDLCWDYKDKYYFLGKKAGFIKKSSKNAEEKCNEFIKLFENMKKDAKNIIKTHTV